MVVGGVDPGIARVQARVIGGGPVEGVWRVTAVVRRLRGRALVQIQRMLRPGLGGQVQVLRLLRRLGLSVWRLPHSALRRLEVSVWVRLTLSWTLWPWLTGLTLSVRLLLLIGRILTCIMINMRLIHTITIALTSVSIVVIMILT